MRPGVVVVVISSSGRVAELIDVADRARAVGAKLIAITASKSPLARKADVALLVDHVEDVATHLPMISRILSLLMIDILAVGVAMRRGAQGVAALGADSMVTLDETSPEQRAPTARRNSPGVSTAGACASDHAQPGGDGLR